MSFITPENINRAYNLTTGLYKGYQIGRNLYSEFKSSGKKRKRIPVYRPKVIGYKSANMLGAARRRPMRMKVKARGSKLAKKRYVTKSALEAMCQSISPIVDCDILVQGQQLDTINTAAVITAVPQPGSENFEVFSAKLLGPNGNIALGLLNNKQSQGLIACKHWAGMNIFMIQALADAVTSQRNITNIFTVDAGPPGVNVPVNKDGAVDTNRFAPKDKFVQFYKTVTTHKFRNFTNTTQTLRVVYYKNISKTRADALGLWGNDLASRALDNPNGFDSLPQMRALPFSRVLSTAGGNVQPIYYFDNYQNATILDNSQGKLLTPDNGCRLFREFNRVTKVRTFTVQPGETVTCEHVQPGFIFRNQDQYINVVDIDGTTNPLNNVTTQCIFNPKWSSGMFFLLRGEEFAQNRAINTTNTFAASAGNDAANIYPCHLHHTYTTKFRVRAGVEQNRNPRLTIGHRPSDGDTGVLDLATAVVINEEEDAQVGIQSA